MNALVISPGFSGVKTPLINLDVLMFDVGDEMTSVATGVEVGGEGSADTQQQASNE